MINLKNFWIREKTYIDHWFEVDERIRFLITAVINMFIRYLLFVVIGWGLGRHYQLTLLGAWIVSSFLAFGIYKKLVFRTEGNHLKEYFRSLLIWLQSYVVNALILALLTGYWGLNANAAQALALTVIMGINYLLFKHFAFKKVRPLTKWERLQGFFNVFGK